MWVVFYLPEIESDSGKPFFNLILAPIFYHVLRIQNAKYALKDSLCYLQVTRK